MKSQRKIFIVFVLNLLFSAFEFIGGFFTGSVAIISDAVHDMGDAFGIGLSFVFEKKSQKQPDEKYTYGYGRYSVIGGMITTVILLVSSALMIYNAISRMIEPISIDYKGMIVFAVIGLIINSFAAYFTRDSNSLNQKAVNLHMLEDVLGWAVVLVGSVVMIFTDFTILDPILSIGISCFIVFNCFSNLKDVFDALTERAPSGIDVNEIITDVKKLDGIVDVHHVHIWSLDGVNNYLTMHIVSDSDPIAIKGKIRKLLKEFGVNHITIELETTTEQCTERQCVIELSQNHHHNHQYRHHH